MCVHVVGMVGKSGLRNHDRRPKGMDKDKLGPRSINGGGPSQGPKPGFRGKGTIVMRIESEKTCQQVGGDDQKREKRK